MLRSREEYIDPIRCLEEATVLAGVAANETDDDNLGLLSLEVVDGGDPDAFQQCCLPKLCSRRCLQSLSGSLQFLNVFLIALIETNLEHGLHATP
jgi:hypothetical protein